MTAPGFAGWRAACNAISALVDALEVDDALTAAEESALSSDIAGFAAGLVLAGRSHAERLDQEVAALHALTAVAATGPEQPR